MIIRKLFKFEGSHIVRNCYSERCKYSLHGHSYKVELKLEANELDFAQMVLDFGVLKGTVKDLIDSFDHCHVIWNRDHHTYKEDMRKYSARWIETPMSPSAESLAIMFHYLITKIINNTVFKNGEGEIKVHSVRVHETDTGYAEAFESDVAHHLASGFLDLDFFKFSEEVMADWTNPTMMEDLKRNMVWPMAKPIQQV